jgi:hypothetical protein
LALRQKASTIELLKSTCTRAKIRVMSSAEIRPSTSRLMFSNPESTTTFGWKSFRSAFSRASSRIDRVVAGSSLSATRQASTFICATGYLSPRECIPWDTAVAGNGDIARVRNELSQSGIVAPVGPKKRHDD